MRDWHKFIMPKKEPRFLPFLKFDANFTLSLSLSLSLKLRAKPPVTRLFSLVRENKKDKLAGQSNRP